MPTKKKTTDKKRIIDFAVCVAFFVVAGVLQYVDESLQPFWTKVCSITATVIFLMLIFMWGYSVKNRIVSKSTQRMVLAVASLLFFWLLIRCVKYEFLNSYDKAARYLWYLYYVPQCLVPPIALIAALNVTKKTDKPTSKWIYLIFVPAIVLILLILTNDLHQIAFIFKPNFERFYSDYKHGVVYYLAIGWMVLVTLAALVTLALKCSISACRKRTWLPLTVFAVCTIVCILCFVYATKSYKVPELLSFSFILTFESCIAIGLIPSNENYATYFDASAVSSVITDENLNPAYRTAKSPIATLEQYELAKADGQTLLDEDTRLSHKSISGGSVFYAENLTQINELLRELSVASEELSEESELIAYENDLKERKAKIEQKNRLCDRIMATVSDELNFVQNLVSEIDENSDYFEQNLRGACVRLAYVKRRSNLEFIKDGCEDMDVNEIALSLKESLGYLSDCGVTTMFVGNASGEYDGRICTLAYDFFEECIERALPTLTDVIVKLSSNEQTLSVRVVTSGAQKDCADFEKEQIAEFGGYIDVKREDDCVYQTLTFKTGGATR